MGESEKASRGQPAKGKSRGGRLIFGSALALLALGLVGMLLWQVTRMEHQVSRLAAQVDQSNRRVQELARKSDQAMLRALSAEQQARQAASERNQAVAARAQAEKATQQAQQQAASAQQQASAAEQKAAEYRRQREAELERLQQVLGQIAETRRSAMGLVMTLGSNSIRFDFDKSDIKPQYRDILNRIAGVLMTLKGYQIYVYGYTDDIGTQEYNLKLSERRATAVREFLVKAGLNPRIITSKGFGKADPRAPGSSPEARAKNRRVEIGIVDSRLLPGAVPAGKN
jgi:outer membrane protein OmpA-like peptidoglycan-associated protein